MKKLAVVAAIAIAVCSAKAACVDWSVSGTSDLAGTTVYLLTTINSTYDSVEALTGSAVSSATIVSQGRGKYGTPETTANNASVTTAASFYYAIVASDGKTFNYVEATGMATKVYDPQAQESTPGPFNTVSAANILAGTQGTIGGSTPPTPPSIPEPTSGLLVLLGVAGLALRRKKM